MALVFEDTRECRSCRKQKPESDFKSPKAFTCKECLGFSRKLRGRRIRLAKLGWTEYEYYLAWDAQNGKCAICGDPESTTRGLAADHDHKTGKPRELLCGRCNLILGHSNENPVILNNMIAYIYKHSND